MIVVDTNVMVRLVVGGPDGLEAARLLRADRNWAAPALLFSELRNVLIGFVRGGGVSLDQAREMCDGAALVVAGRIASVSSTQVIDIAQECGLTAYDAEFVAVARALGVRLATLDSKILRAAPDVAVPLVDASAGLPGTSDGKP